ncbi:MAG TPA: hypothetical protein VMU36_11465, partial [Spirochaetia bacterium]|nr:hypothetical protein [Spirochaetia bacterium]
IEPHQVLPAVTAILVDKYGYVCRSHNLTENFDNFDYAASEVGKWRALDLVVMYFHPELGVVTINPKNRSHWESVRSLKKNELVTVFAGAFDETDGDPKYQEGINLLLSILQGSRIRTPPAFTKGRFVLKKLAVQLPPPAPVRGPKPKGRRPTALLEAAAAAATATTMPPALQSYVAQQTAAAAAPAAPKRVVAAATAPRKMTPMYSIPVTNELFHNGNVEAWKKIIQSYTTKYPGLEVYVFYEGERIHDINTLFKWGKVKHGSSIMIAIAGDDIRDVAKLQRYLKQGASHLFEAFLKGQVGAVLNLF